MNAHDDVAPPGWAFSNLSDMGVLYCGQSPSSATVNRSGVGAPYVTGPEQWDGTRLHVDKWTTAPTRLVPDGCLFITVKGAGVGTMFPGISCAIGRDVYAFRPAPGIEPGFVELALRANIQEVIQKANGLIPGLSREHIMEHRVPVPPAEEQRRIVARIEALSARSRRAKVTLDAIPPLLDRFRRSVLAAAFRGDLTKNWRQQNPAIESATVLVERTPLPDGKPTGRAAGVELRRGRFALSVGDPGTSTPPRWAWVPLSRIAKMESGHTPSRSKPSYWDGDVPWLSIPDARDHHGGRINDTTQRITEQGLANSSARLLPTGTVCLCRTAASIGYVNIMGRSMATSQDFADWICGPALLPEYLMYALVAEGPDGLSRFGEGTAHKTIYFPELKALHVCLAPLDEQREIVRVLREQLARIDRLAEAAEGLRKRAASIEPAILAKAFRGELVPQDPNDVPASALLERVRAERVGAQPGDKVARRYSRRRDSAARNGQSPADS